MKSWLVIDTSLGSSGKGLIAGYLARKWQPSSVVCNFGANAGHTFVFSDNAKIMTQQLPTGIITDSVKNIFIGPGSIIDPEILDRELDSFYEFIRGKNILIHPRAAVITQQCKDIEKQRLNCISSTCKGVGAAMAEKILRSESAIMRSLIGTEHKCAKYIVSEEEYCNRIMESKSLQIESAQGFELGLNTGFQYPYCTSRDVTPAQIISDCGLPHDILSGCTIIGTARTYPIRVGSVKDVNGSVIGYSGDVYDDQTELTWAELGQPEERTTVTNKIRRVFTFSWKGFNRVLKFVQPHLMFLNFVNYLEPNPSFTTPKTAEFIKKMDEAAGFDIVEWIGVGPRETDVIHR